MSNTADFRIYSNEVGLPRELGLRYFTILTQPDGNKLIAFELIKMVSYS